MLRYFLAGCICVVLAQTTVRAEETAPEPKATPVARNVIEDKGLTSDQVLAKIQYVFGHIDLKEPEKYVDYGVGLSSAQLNRMISACVVRMFERVQGEKGTWRDAGLNPDFFREWREQHVKPRV